MRSIVYMQPGAASKVLFSEEAENPQVAGHDLLVEIRAISVNPVDTKVRAGMAPPSGQSRTLGWDAAGVVRAVGPLVSLFEVGDEVYYAGDLQRPGAYSELHLVDERLVGHKPRTLSFAEAAAMPLTSITAYELLFERLGIPLDGSARGKSLLVVGAAGGVGSILVQLAANIAGLTVVATASRPESRRWLKNLGAHFVLDHLQPLSLELARIGMGGCDYAASLNHSEEHFGEIVRCLYPQGRIGLIDDPDSLDVMLLKPKSLSLHWEFMFTRSLFATDDRIAQHALLEKVATWIDDQTLKTTMASHFGKINVENLVRAHEALESHRTTGKIVLEGFDP